MRKFLAWLFPILFTAIALPIAVDYLKKSNPTAADYQTTLGAAWAHIVTFANLPWVLPAATFIGGISLGMGIDWVVRRFDGTRESVRQTIGQNFLDVAYRIRNRQNGFRSEWPENIGDMLPEIGSTLLTAQRQGIISLPAAAFRDRTAYNDAVGYLMTVGQLLVDGHYTEAVQVSRDSANAFLNRNNQRR
jgi:hypothetical protein